MLIQQSFRPTRSLYFKKCCIPKKCVCLVIFRRSEVYPREGGGLWCFPSIHLVSRISTKWLCPTRSCTRITYCLWKMPLSYLLVLFWKRNSSWSKNWTSYEKTVNNIFFSAKGTPENIFVQLKDIIFPFNLCECSSCWNEGTRLKMKCHFVTNSNFYTLEYLFIMW